MSLRVFNHVTADGYFAGTNGETDWFQSVHDDEWKRYRENDAVSARSTLMFGRITYDMMKSFWPTSMAKQMDPKMAEVMINSRKVVFSRTLKDVKDEENWRNVSVFREINPEAIKELKKRDDVMILGSGTVVQQLTNLDLIDEYVLVTVPVILGSGRSLFNDVQRKNLRLHEVKHFSSGIVLLKYRPA